VDERASLRLGGGEACGKNQRDCERDDEIHTFPEWESETLGGYPPSPGVY
jgi:hypothetical protein